MNDKNYTGRIPEQLELPLFYNSSESHRKSYSKIPTSDITQEEFERRLEKAFADLPRRLEALERAKYLDWETLHMWIGAGNSQAA